MKICRYVLWYGIRYSVLLVSLGGVLSAYSMMGGDQNRLVVIPQNDKEAYRYCLDHRDSFFAIVWPIAKGHEEKVIKTFNKYGTFIYRAERRLTKTQVREIFVMAHQKVPSFIMGAHISWYFPPDAWKRNARIYIVRFRSLDAAVACKQEIRDFFDLSYRSIHIGDTHNETMWLAQYFFRDHKHIGIEGEIVLSDDEDSESNICYDGVDQG